MWIESEATRIIVSNGACDMTSDHLDTIHNEPVSPPRVPSVSEIVLLGDGVGDMQIGSAVLVEGVLPLSVEEAPFVPCS